jgi:hypothetical protein
MPAERRHQFLHQGHCSFVTEAERKFVTPTLIRSTLGMVGTRDEIIDRVHEMEENGLREIVLLPDFARRRDVFADFAREVMANC